MINLCYTFFFGPDVSVSQSMQFCRAGVVRMEREESVTLI